MAAAVGFFGGGIALYFIQLIYIQEVKVIEKTKHIYFVTDCLLKYVG